MDGQCCERFTIQNMSPAEIQAKFGTNKENNQVILMIKYLGKFDKNILGKKITGGIHYYECRNFDKKTRKCTIYNNRPKMCSGYPSYLPSKECEYPVECSLREICNNPDHEANNPAPNNNELGK